MVKLLLEGGRADPTAAGNEVIRMKYGYEAVVSLLLENGRADQRALASVQRRLE